MRERFVAVVMACLLSAGLAGRAWAQPAESADRHADRAVAARLSGVAQQLLRDQQHLSRPAFEQAAILFATAARLDPQEPRYWRLLAEAEIEAGNREGAIQALQGLEDVDPRNTIPAVWVRLIDLYLQGMQQASQRLEYLERVYNQTSVPASARSHAAFRIAEQRIEQAAPGLALEWVGKALEQNPVNPAAARLQWALVSDSDDPRARVKALMTLVQADPGTLPNIATFADELARAGFFDASLTWYALAIQLAGRMGVTDPGLVFDYAAELFIANNELAASNLVTQLLEADPNHVDALFLRLLLDRDKPREMSEPTRKSARESLIRRLAEVRKQASVNAPEGSLELAADLQALQAPEASDELKATYAGVVADLLWFDLYFGGVSESTDRMLEFLRAIAPADSATLARLEGWNFLLRNRPDEARVKLEAAVDRDPLARLGLLRMFDRNDDAAMQEMTRQGAELLSEHPSGLVGAFLAGELRRFGVRVQPNPAVADIANDVRNFTRDWPQAYSNPGAFYTVRVQPLKVSHEIGEPILARIEIQNNSTQYALSVDPIGAIRPDLWFDARVQGAIQQNLSGVAYDRLMGEVVLRPRGATSQVVRLDRGTLAPLLDGNPQLAFPVMFSLSINPQTLQAESGESFVVPGLLGQAVQFARIVHRESALPHPNTINQVTNTLQGGLPEKKIEAIDYIRYVVPMLRRQLAEAELSDEQRTAMHDLVNQLLFQLSRARQEPVPAIAAWASYSSALVVEGDQRAEILRQMRTGSNAAQMILSLVAAHQLDPALARDVAGRLAQNEDPLVKRLAAATLAVAEAAASQPAPAPEGQK